MCGNPDDRTVTETTQSLTLMAYTRQQFPGTSDIVLSAYNSMYYVHRAVRNLNTYGSIFLKTKNVCGGTHL